MNLVENQTKRTIKTLKTNHGHEYLSEQFKELCDEKGIQRQLTIYHTPQKNGVTKRRNHTLVEMVRLIMAQANPPVSFLGDALLTMAYILNRVPSKLVLQLLMSNGLGTSPIWTIYAHGDQQGMFTLLPIDMGS